MRFSRASILLSLISVVFLTFPISGSGQWDSRPTPLDYMHEAQVPLEVGAISAVLRDSQDPELRYWGALALAQLGDMTALPVLIEAANDANAYVRTGAVSALAYFHFPESGRVLKRVIQTDSEPSIRLAAIISIGQFDSEFRLDGLAHAATRQDEDWSTRNTALYWLGEIGTEDAITLASGLRQDSDPSLRAQATLITSKARGSVGLEELVTITLDEDIDEFTRTKLVRHLEMITGQSFINDEDQERSEKYSPKRKIADWWESSTGRGLSNTESPNADK